jgi:uncharacterized protein
VRPLLQAIGLGCALVLSTGAAALPVPELTARVNDGASLLTPSQRQALEERLAGYERQTGHQFALLTVPTLNGDSLEGFSIHVAERWRLGDKRRSDGLILLVVPLDRKMRIEVGYGLEGAIPDVLASRVIRETLAPSFRHGDYVGGIDAAFTQLMQLAQGESLGPAHEPPERGHRTTGLANVFFLGLGVMFLLSRILNRWVSALLFGSILGVSSYAWLGSLVASAFASGVGFFLGLIFGSIPRLGGWGGGGWGGGGWGGWGGGGFGGGGGGWSSGGDSGGGFSGGGGGFGGGGASGSW